MSVISLVKTLKNHPASISHLVLVSGLEEGDEEKIAIHNSVSITRGNSTIEVSLIWKKLSRGVFYTNSPWSDHITFIATEHIFRRVNSNITLQLVRIVHFLDEHNNGLNVY
jgi:hypothetical protein